MQLEYYKLTPARKQPDSDNVVQHFSGLHHLDDDSADPSLSTKLLRPLLDGEITVPRFVFLMMTEGGKNSDAPVEFLYGTGENWMSTLGHTLETAYPQSFDIKRVTVDRQLKTIQPAEFAARDFVNNLQRGSLRFSDATDQSSTPTRSPDDYSVGSDQLDTRFEEPTLGTLHQTQSNGYEQRPPQFQQQTGSQDDVPPPLSTLTDSTLAEISPPSAIDSSQPIAALEGPAMTTDGTVMARPSLENCEPIAIRWNGKGERKRDWMTTLEFYKNLMQGEDEDATAGRSPLAALIDFMAQADFPLAFQVVFQRKQDWSKKARDRKFDIHTNRDTLTQKAMRFLSDSIHGTSSEHRREVRRRPIDDIGETVSRDDAPSTGEVADRQSLIDLKEPYRTFKANVRAVSVAPTEAEADRIQQEMQDLTTRLSTINGYYYHLKPEVIRNSDERFFDGKPPATREYERFLKRSLITGSGKLRPDLILNTQELANFITVPSQGSLTTQGSRGSRGKPSSRDPLPRPHSDLMQHFHGPGMEIGYACDKRDEPEDIPTAVPPRLLDTHYARFAATGGGKSVSLINDMLSLYQNTGGPTILIDPKGDGMPDQYMKAHFERYGEQDLRENVIYFDLPEVLPGFTFFDIRAELEEGMRRVDAVQNKADHYIEIMKLVMGEEQFQNSKVAPTLMKALIKALFDSEHGSEQYSSTHINRRRESSDVYSHNDLEHAAEELQRYVTNRSDPDCDLGSLPEVTDNRIRRTLTRHAESEERDFSTIIDAVFNRLDYIREDTHLRRIFDNTNPKFDFRDHLDDDTVIVFDLGGLRDEAAKIMTGLILTNLWDAIQNHDQHYCERGHESLTQCQQYAQQRGADPINPPCRTPWGDDHMVNLIIDEAASVAMSDIMSKLFEQGRSFSLSVGLAAQFPSQMESAGNTRTYNTLFNNIGTLLFGQLQLEQDVAEVLSHENTDTHEFKNRISNLPKGEWVAQLPSPRFGQTGPEPFTLLPLEPPSGHDDGDNPLSQANRQYLQQLVNKQIIPTAQQTYGVPREAYESAAHASDDVAFTDDTRGDSTHTQTPATAQQTDAESPSSTDEASTGGTGRSSPASASDHGVQSALPEHVELHEWGLHCTRCDSVYGQNEQDRATECCAESSSNDDSNHSGQSTAGDTEATEHNQADQLVNSVDGTIPTHGGTCTEYNLQSVIRGVDLPDWKIERRPVGREELTFMTSVLAVMNNETPIPRYASLRPLRDEFESRGVDIEHLAKEGYVTPHRKPTLTYTVEDKGKALLSKDRHVRAGPGVGDRGDGMPHRFGTDLATEWLAKHPRVDGIRSFISLSDDDQRVMDILGYSNVGGKRKVHTVVEVEGGRSSSESSKYSSGNQSGSHDYASFAKDYELMASINGLDDRVVQGGAQAVWIVRNRDIANRIVDALAAQGKLDCDPAEIKAAGDNGFGSFNDVIQQYDLDGLTAMYSFRAIKRRI